MYTLEGRVRYSECDETGTLSPVALIDYLQDAATFHSEDLGRGVTYMTPLGLAWLIAAWQIRINRLPSFGEPIRVLTWCHDMSHTLAARNFVLADGQGAHLVEADSLWFVYDHVNGRPVRIPEDQYLYLEGDAPLDLPVTQRRIPVRGAGTAMPELVVQELHLDSNRHVNNAQYVGMALDTLLSQGASPAAGRRLAGIDVQYKLQARLGDTIVPWVHGDGDTRTVDLRSPEGDSYAIVRLGLRAESPDA